MPKWDRKERSAPGRMFGGFMTHVKLFDFNGRLWATCAMFQPPSLYRVWRAGLATADKAFTRMADIAKASARLPKPDLAALHVYFIGEQGYMDQVLKLAMKV